METVAVDTPLSWATSRRVTAVFFLLRRLTDSLRASPARYFRLRRAVFFIISNDAEPAERIGQQRNEIASCQECIARIARPASAPTMVVTGTKDSRHDDVRCSAHRPARRRATKRSVATADRTTIAFSTVFPPPCDR